MVNEGFTVDEEFRRMVRLRHPSCDEFSQSSLRTCICRTLKIVTMLGLRGVAVRVIALGHGIIEMLAVVFARYTRGNLDGLAIGSECADEKDEYCPCC